MRHTVAAVLLACVTTLSLCNPAGAVLDEWGIGLKAGTLGVGGELATNLLSNVNLRGSLQWFDLDLDMEFDEIDYDLEVEMLNPMVLIDWYPFSNSFRVSGGVLFNGTDISLDATTDEEIEIGDETYTADEIGRLRGESDFDEVAPYVGIGFGNPLTRDEHWGFSFDIGVAFIGSPGVTLTATGPVADTAEFQQNLADEEADIEDELDKIKVCPVLSLCLYYVF
ncbi:MAG: hypothetical protein KBE65_19010 [Phycisphaerae bacterium]|nr:hypothetical protein [Phycisphaerae bacterium]